MALIAAPRGSRDRHRGPLTGKIWRKWGVIHEKRKGISPRIPEKPRDAQTDVPGPQQRQQTKTRHRAMSGFGSLGGGGGMGGGGGQPSDDQIMAAVLMNLQQEEAMRFFVTVREKCFDKCIEKPSGSMSSGEERCLSHCLGRYVDATRAVAEGLTQASQ